MFPSDAEWGMAMRDAWGLPQIARSNTDAIRGAFIKKHETRRSPTDQREVISPMCTDRSFHGFFTLAPRPTAWFLMRRRRNGWARILSQTGREMHLCKSERSVGDN